MPSIGVTLFESNPIIAQSLASSLGEYFRSVHVAASIDELKQSIAKHRDAVAIVDLEPTELDMVADLHHEFPAVSIVCTHRLADEGMWTAVLDAGGSDVCHPADTQGILQSAIRSARHLRAAVA
jgi:hypothetical protein